MQISKTEQEVVWINLYQILIQSSNSKFNVWAQNPKYEFVLKNSIIYFVEFF